MKHSEAVSLHQLLRVAEKNLVLAEKSMHEDVILKEVVGLRDAVRSVMLALQQTINALHKVVDDLD